MLARSGLPGSVLAVLLAFAGSAPAVAQSAAQWPTKPVSVVVPFAAGGNTDVVARIFTDRLGARLGQPFLIENRTGAGGSTGITGMVKAAPDGYTIGVVTSGTLFILPHIYQDKLGYDGVKDLRPVALVGRQPNVVVVHPKIPAKSVAELFAYLKANPDKDSYGSSGIGTSQHLCMELIVQHTGARIAHVPYRASNQIMQDLIAGQIQMTCDQFSTAYEQVKAGNARAIAVTSLERYPPEPTIPAMAETVAGFDVTWAAVFITSSAVPTPIAEKLAAELSLITKELDVAKRLRDLWVTPASVTGAELAARIKADYDTWKPIVEKAKIPRP